MDALAYIFLGQLIFCGATQLLITLPTIYLLFKFYIKKSYSVVLQLYFIYLSIFGVATILNSIYLISIWSPEPKTYNLRMLSLTGFLPWALQFPMYQFEFFLTLERCFAIFLKQKYSNFHKKLFGILSFIAPIIFVTTFFIADKYPIFVDNNNIQTTCKFYGCIIDQGSTVVMMTMTYSNCFVNLFFIGVLLFLVFLYLKSISSIETFMYKNTVINVLILIIIQWIPHILSALSYAILENKLTAILGPIRYTRSCIAVSTSASIYYLAFRKRTKKEQRSVIAVKPLNNILR